MIARLKNILTSVSIEHCTSIIKRIKALKGKGRVVALGKICYTMYPGNQKQN